MAEANNRVGAMFGKYKLTGLLGQGGMGEVWEAYNTSKDRTVALKILREEFSHDGQYRTRFQRESRAAATLEEPHVIPIYDWGETDGNLFIDMRLVRGQDLHELLKQGPLQPERAVGIIRQIASALDAAHAQGLIHRDVKPKNILVTSAEDFAYLIDFGIAAHRNETRLTVAGSAIGSFAYMAPERFEDRPITAAVDIYSLAAVLYEALTGEPPFKASGVQQMIAAHATLPPPRPSLVNRRLPVAFDDVIARGMAKDPDERYGSAGALGRAAQRMLEAPLPKPGQPDAVTRAAPTAAAGPASYGVGPLASPAWQAAQQPPPRPGGRRLMPTVLVVTAALLLGGIGVVFGLTARRQSSAPPTQAAPSAGYAIAVPAPSPQPEAPSSPLSPSAPEFPPTPMGPDNSAAHVSCDDGYSLPNMSGFGTHAQRGTPETSCFFAKSVLIAYWNLYGNVNRELRTVSAPGTVPCPMVGGGAVCDHNNFVMQCAAYGSDMWITCRGGNDAVVYLY